MRNNHATPSIMLGLSIVIAAAMLASAGDLNPPPGPVTPTMKSLDEIEPRIAINAQNTPGDADSLYRISAPGSYYLTQNIAGIPNLHAIEIAADDVAIDLMGYTLTGPPTGSTHGIRTDGSFDRIAIRNGTVRDWPGSGVQIGFGDGHRIESVVADSNGLSGIDLNGNGPSTISNCHAMNNGSIGIDTGGGCTVTQCVAISNASTGISLSGSNGVARGNIARLNAGSGIAQNAGGDWLIKDNVCNDNAFHGISMCYGSSIINNHCTGNGTAITDGAGIQVRCGGNRVDSNHLEGNDIGIRMSINNDELVVRNTYTNNGSAFTNSTGNQVGPLGFPSTATSPWANLLH